MQRLGDYDIVRMLGTGGMAEVYLAEKRVSGGMRKQVVLKRILPHLRQLPEYNHLFKREAELALNIRHPNLVQLLDFSRIDGEQVLVMEYIDGISLAEIDPGRLSDALAAYIGVQVLSGLRALHEAEPSPVLHRDISPGNIMLDRSGNVRLTDFGIACLIDDPQASRHTRARGTWRYLPPERRAGTGLFPASDIYSLAMVLLEMTSGAPNKPVEVPSALADWLGQCEASGHAELVAVLRGWLATDADERPASAREALTALNPLAIEPLQAQEALARLVGGIAGRGGVGESSPSLRRRTAVLPISANEDEPSREPDQTAPARRLVGRKKITAIAGGLALLAVLVLGGLWVSSNPRSESNVSSGAWPRPERFVTQAIVPIDSRPDARILLDGQALGETPLVLEVAPGRHELRLEVPGKSLSVSLEVFLLPGANPEIYTKF